MKDEKNNKPVNTDNNDSLEPDPGTLHKTDPQENMEGPVSSLMHKTGKAFETNESREEANRKKEENM